MHPGILLPARLTFSLGFLFACGVGPGLGIALVCRMGLALGLPHAFWGIGLASRLPLPEGMGLAWRLSLRVVLASPRGSPLPADWPCLREFPGLGVSLACGDWPGLGLALPVEWSLP